MDDLVFDTIGITELQFQKLSNEHKIALLKQYGNIGYFSTQNIKTLKSKLNCKPKYRTSIEILEHIDIANLQAIAPPNSMIQIASNFNCLENSDIKYIEQNIVTGYYYDVSQGPAASFGPIIGVLYRTYCCGQHNLLDDTKINIINGKVKLIGSTLDVNYLNIKLGIHTNIDVLYDRNGKIQKHNTVSQVLTSSINLNYNYINIKLLTPFLQAAYEGSYLAAITNNCKNLYLTLIGGDSFNNPLDLIVEAIKNAHQLYGNYLEHVYICIYGQNQYICDIFKN